MFKNNIKFTTAQFAKLHNINKRTLHYYDNIGLFSPSIKGENNYRYYDLNQMMELDYILMLKRLGMSIEEIKNYLKTPTPNHFLEMTDKKIPQIEKEIKELEVIRDHLKYKQDILNQCSNIKNTTIQICDCEEEYLVITETELANGTLEEIYNCLKKIPNTEQVKLGYGSFISWNKLLNDDYSYDGIYVQLNKRDDNYPNLYIKEKGKYLCAYYKGLWDNLPSFYKEVVEFANANNLTLTGYAYETGLNDFVVTSIDEYITKITIKIKNN